MASRLRPSRTGGGAWGHDECSRNDQAGTKSQHASYHFAIATRPQTEAVARRQAGPQCLDPLSHHNGGHGYSITESIVSDAADTLPKTRPPQPTGSFPRWQTRASLLCVCGCVGGRVGVCACTGLSSAFRAQARLACTSSPWPPWQPLAALDGFLNIVEAVLFQPLYPHNSTPSATRDPRQRHTWGPTGLGHGHAPLCRIDTASEAEPPILPQYYMCAHGMSIAYTAAHGPAWHAPRTGNLACTGSSV